jgi:hypothetical protein
VASGIALCGSCSNVSLSVTFYVRLPNVKNKGKGGGGCNTLKLSTPTLYGHCCVPGNSILCVANKSNRTGVIKRIVWSQQRTNKYVLKRYCNDSSAVFCCSNIQHPVSHSLPWCLWRWWLMSGWFVPYCILFGNIMQRPSLTAVAGWNVHYTLHRYPVASLRAPRELNYLWGDLVSCKAVFSCYCCL